MTSPPKRDFSAWGVIGCGSFAYFDAARTEGYVVPRAGRWLRQLDTAVEFLVLNKMAPHSLELFSAGHDSGELELKTEGGMFSGENEDENIVDKIHRLKMNESGEKSTKSSLLAREMLRGNHSDLFAGSDFGGKGITKGTSDARASSSESIQLNRLLDDYMLGTKGDRIMEQMEELISDEFADTTAKCSGPAEKQPSFVSTDLFGDEESDPSVDALKSMADFEKYISEN